VFTYLLIIYISKPPPNTVGKIHNIKVASGVGLELGCCKVVLGWKLQ